MGSMNILWILCIKQLDERIDYLLEETHRLTSPIISHRLSPGSAKIHQASFGQTLSFQQINQLQTQWRWLQAYRNLHDSCSSKKISWIKPGHGKKKLLTISKATTQFNTMAEGKKKNTTQPFFGSGKKKKQKHTQSFRFHLQSSKKTRSFHPPRSESGPNDFKFKKRNGGINSQRLRLRTTSPSNNRPGMAGWMAHGNGRSARHGWYLPPLVPNGHLDRNSLKGKHWSLEPFDIVPGGVFWGFRPTNPGFKLNMDDIISVYIINLFTVL